MLLYSPIKFRNLSLANRLVMSPMCMFSAENGVPNDFHFVHYASRSQGGVGLVMVEATAIEPKGRITPKCCGIWNQDQISAFRRITDFVHQYSESKIGIQLSHSGRKGATWNGNQIVGNNSWQTVAPSAIPYQPNDCVPHELSIDEIQEIVNQFKQAAINAVDAGFDVIELHAAHGYLIHQFLSPLSNQRKDKYGGSFLNRIRFLIEIIAAVQSVLDENHALFVRISADEYAEHGWCLEDSIELSKLLKSHAVDLVDVSSGGNIFGVTITLFNKYQVPFASEIRKNTGIFTGAVGLITTVDQAEEILQKGEADLVFIGRELLKNPYLPIQGAITHQADCFFPVQYAKSKN